MLNVKSNNATFIINWHFSHTFEEAILSSVWRKQHLCNICVLQRVHLSILILLTDVPMPSSVITTESLTFLADIKCNPSESAKAASFHDIASISIIFSSRL
jgi:hypothetical protein